MLPTLVALLAGATSEVWVSLQPAPADDASCSAETLAAVITRQRPALAVKVWRPGEEAEPPAGAVRVRLTRGSASSDLDLSGAAVSVKRTLPGAECARDLETVALIVDEALDQLLVPTAAPHVASLAPTLPFSSLAHLSAALLGGAEQGMYSAVAAFGADVTFRYRFLSLGVRGDVGLPSSLPFTSESEPEATVNGAFKTMTFCVGADVGFEPRLGPGRLLAAVTAGLEATVGRVQSNNLFQIRSRTAYEPYGGLRLGYAFDLPHGIFLGATGEERLAASASFSIDGVELPNAHAGTQTRQWTVSVYRGVAPSSAAATAEAASVG